MRFGGVCVWIGVGCSMSSIVPGGVILMGGSRSRWGRSGRGGGDGAVSLFLLFGGDFGRTETWLWFVIFLVQGHRTVMVGYYTGWVKTGFSLGNSS